MTTLAADSLPYQTFLSTTRRSLTIAALFVCWLLYHSTFVVAQSPDDLVIEVRGQTMGTTYMVKVFDPPGGMDETFAESVDAELRRVNDQMSTYLKSSEISRFNASNSTDWFDVSAETAAVVEYALEVSRKTNGAFDVTVGPLVNLWNFGPETRNRSVPSESEIATRQKQIGYQHLEVRKNPPAIRKALSEVQVDLSAIAKGHGVDRVVELLSKLGAKDVFVEIGGEVRATGDKDGSPWMVGIQRPDSELNTLLVRRPLKDAAMATSGDYRNRFEVDGKFFSHTIDPKTGCPVTHDMASVTVIADDCMRADAWATAINVLGPDAGLQAAKDNQLDVLLVSRVNGVFKLAGTGSLESAAVASKVASKMKQEPASLASRVVPMLVLTLIVFMIVAASMAVGVVFGRKPISGSCGGLAGTTTEDGVSRCSLCSNAVDGCKELRDRIQKQNS
jgi:FAD:protein FMN transferase